MRLEATVPDSRGATLLELASDLGLTKSQVIDEALALFLEVILDARNGRCLVASGQGCEADLIAHPPKPTEALKPGDVDRGSLTAVHPHGHP